MRLSETRIARRQVITRPIDHLARMLCVSAGVLSVAVYGATMRLSPGDGTLAPVQLVGIGMLMVGLVLGGQCWRRWR